MEGSWSQKCQCIVQTPVTSGSEREPSPQLHHFISSVSRPSPAQHGIAAFEKAHTCSPPSLKGLLLLVLETVPMVVLIEFSCCPLTADCQPLRFSSCLPFRCLLLWCHGLLLVHRSCGRVVMRPPRERQTWVRFPFFAVGLFPGRVDCLVGLVVKASASRAEDPGFESRLRRGFFRGRVIPVTQKLALQWRPCQAPGVIGSALGLVGPVSVYRDWMR